MTHSSESNFLFEVGQLVHHRRYGYRGVVFGRDAMCTAGNAWYMKNLTQPDRDQPWYHVMVDGAAHTTYVAETNLEPDELLEPVVHPLLNKVFLSFYQGRYYRESMN
mgnify:CR=1 FL=1